jgi:hypothetical protein
LCERRRRSKVSLGKDVLNGRSARVREPSLWPVIVVGAAFVALSIAVVTVFIPSGWVFAVVVLAGALGMTLALLHQWRHGPLRGGLCGRPCAGDPLRGQPDRCARDRAGLYTGVATVGILLLLMPLNFVQECAKSTRLKRARGGVAAALGAGMVVLLLLNWGINGFYEVYESFVSTPRALFLIGVVVVAVAVILRLVLGARVAPTRAAEAAEATGGATLEGGYAASVAAH